MHRLLLSLVAAVLLLGCSRGMKACGVYDPVDQTPVPPPPSGASIKIDESSLALMRDVRRRKPANANSPLGTNLVAPTYSSRDWVFVDRMKAAMGFVSTSSEDWDDKRPLPLDDRGFPKRLLPNQEAATIVPTYAGGHSVLTYAGQGELRLEASNGPARIIDQRPGRIEFEVKRDQELIISIISTKVGDHIRDMRIVRKSFEGSREIFQPVFLERLAVFKVLRFMDWASTNNQNLVRWENRTRPDWFTQSMDTGVAYEYMVRLGNALHADIWVCIPHKANNTLVQGLAELIAAGLDEDLKVYVEYSNEIWNSTFDQSAYAAEQGNKLRLHSDEFRAAARFQSQRSIEIFKIFERAFAERPETLVRVMGSQVGNKWHHADLVEHRDAMANVDAIAVAPYFGHNWGLPEQAEMMKSTEDGRLLRKIEEEAMGETFEAIRLSATYAKSIGKRLVAYEGGQHVVPSPATHEDRELDAKINAIQRHPYMGKLYEDLLATWKREGGQLFVNFTMIDVFSRWSKFAVLEYQDQPRKEAPKFDALMTFIEENPVWWE